MQPPLQGVEKYLIWCCWMKASKTGERCHKARLLMFAEDCIWSIFILSKSRCVCLSVNHKIHFIVNTTSKHAVTHTQRLSAVQCAEVKMGFIFGANLRTMPLNCDRPSLTLACSGKLDLPLFPFFLSTFILLYSIWIQWQNLYHWWTYGYFKSQSRVPQWVPVSQYLMKKKNTSL